MTGCTNITMGDWTARRQQKFEPDVLFLSIPYERMHNLITAIPDCSAGDAEAVIPEEFQSDYEDLAHVLSGFLFAQEKR